jgi:hypothetical protein
VASAVGQQQERGGIHTQRKAGVRPMGARLVQSMTDDEIEALKEELLGTISALEIQVGQLKDEVNNLQSRIERLENE